MYVLIFALKYCTKHVACCVPRKTVSGKLYPLVKAKIQILEDVEIYR